MEEMVISQGKTPENVGGWWGEAKPAFGKPEKVGM